MPRKYDGIYHTANTLIRQAVTVATRMTWDAIEAIENLVNTICTNVIVQTPEINRYSLTSQVEVLANQDCRLFNEFLCFGSLRSVKAFMSADKDRHADAQVNCMFTMHHFCEIYKYSFVQARVIFEHFDLAKKSLLEGR